MILQLHSRGTRLDLVNHFVGRRYANSSEEAWRILGLSYAESLPMAARLEVYLGGCHTV